MANWTIYYNPKCGTCRNTLALLEENKIKPRVVEYLKTPPSVQEIDEMLKKLKMEPHDLARKKEPIYAELKLDTRKLSRKEWLQILHDNPILIERPVVIKDNQAIVARPFEKVRELL